MRDEYDFTNAQRGKFHRPGLHLIPPVHLEPDVLTYLAERAKNKGTSLNALVNQLLKKDIELMKIGT
jgi:hypothetical protein